MSFVDPTTGSVSSVRYRQFYVWRLFGLHLKWPFFKISSEEASTGPAVSHGSSDAGFFSYVWVGAFTSYNDTDGLGFRFVQPILLLFAFLLWMLMVLMEFHAFPTAHYFAYWSGSCENFSYAELPDMKNPSIFAYYLKFDCGQTSVEFIENFMSYFSFLVYRLQQVKMRNECDEN